MNIGLHQVAEGVVDQPVAFQGAAALEERGGDADSEVAAAVPGARVAGVEVAFVDDLQLCRLQGCGEPLADGDQTILVHGSTSLNGLTTTFA